MYAIQLFQFRLLNKSGKLKDQTQKGNMGSS